MKEAQIVKDRVSGRSKGYVLTSLFSPVTNRVQCRLCRVPTRRIRPSRHPVDRTETAWSPDHRPAYRSRKRIDRRETQRLPVATPTVFLSTDFTLVTSISVLLNKICRTSSSLSASLSLFSSRRRKGAEAEAMALYSKFHLLTFRNLMLTCAGSAIPHKLVRLLRK